MVAVKCCAASSSVMPAPAARDQTAQTMSLTSAVAHLNAVSAGVSVEPSDYSWGTPTMIQQQALYSQFLQLAFMCSLPQLQYAHLSSLQPGRTPMFPGFMPPFSGLAGFMPPVTAPCTVPSPPTVACPNSAGPQGPGQQTANLCSGQPEISGGKAVKSVSPSKKSGAASKAKTAKGASVATSVPAAPATCVTKDDPEMELEDICRLLGDDAFLEHLQDDVLSEGSNGSSSTSDGRDLSKNNSNGCLSGNLNNDGGLFPGNSFASAFDVDMDDVPPTAVAAHDGEALSAAAAATKASSGDLNNLVASSPARSTRSSRSAAREAAAAAKEAGVVTRITLKASKGGVHKVLGSKQAKAQAVVQAAATAAAAAAPAVVSPSAASSGADESPLTAADLSRLLGEDDNRIPEGWDLDLDFENPFSCSISAF